MQTILAAILISIGTTLVLSVVHLLTGRSFVLLGGLGGLLCFFTPFVTPFFIDSSALIASTSETIACFAAIGMGFAFLLALAFYSMVDHSVRIRAAVDLLKNKEKQPTLEEILAIYTPDQIAEKRIQKLQTGGYLVEERSGGGVKLTCSIKGLWLGRTLTNLRRLYRLRD